jgi:hypothetical protein
LLVRQWHSGKETICLTGSDFDSPNENKETFANTLQTRDNEEGDEDECEDEEGDDVEGEWVWFDRVKACGFLCFYSNWYMFIRLSAPNYLWFILLNISNNVYYIKMTICRLRKTSFLIKEISESAMSHARSRKILLQNPQILTVVKCRPARSCQ